MVEERRIEHDLIRCLLEAVMAVQPQFTEEQALQVERAIRHEWGGEEVFVAKDMRRRPHMREQIRLDLAAGRPIREIESARGVSRRTLYRMMKKK